MKLLKPPKKEKDEIANVQVNSSMFFQYNPNLGPPYYVIIDTNFINFAIKYKLDILKGLMDVLFAKVIPCVTDCVIGELEKMGKRFNLALRLARDVRFKRLTCDHIGTYADDCLVQRVQQHKCYLVGTNDRDLKRRIRKIPGVPIMSVSRHKMVVERMPDALAAVPSSIRKHQ
eukprot:GHVR01099152.1.p1 GENE.GHVR01099152.1~~GHVR01099152.1.p1  ORF type:complete len:173 (-),score=28.19 GHVR01099152.1:166-684(-)